MSHTIIREITSDNDVQQLTLSALSKIEKVVGDTLGYRGGFNIIENSQGLPELSKDGWTSLKELCFENPIENLVLEIVKEATMKTFDEIADMNPYQQYVAFRGPRIVTVDSLDDVRVIQGKFR